MANPSETPLERLAFRPPEVAALTGFSRQFVYKLISDGRLPARRVGKALYITKDALLAFLDEGEAA